MSFLAPALLFALPLAALPVIIHLIHLHRRRTIEWAAMMFLLAAQQMNRGYSRIRQMLILAMRVLAVLGLILLVARPLAGGWLGLTGGAPDSVIVLLDRSASMEQQNLATGESKRSSAVKKIVQGIEDLFSGRTRVVLIDSASNLPTEVPNPKALADIPATQASDTSADMPAMMQSALDYITTNQIGRADIWIASDLRQSDWNATSGRWEAIRAAFAKLPAVRFHLIAYTQQAEDNLWVRVENVRRRQSADKAELLLDVRVQRQSTNPQPIDVPLQFVVNGTRSTMNVNLKDNELLIQGHAIPMDRNTKRGQGSVELPADSNLRDNVFQFVFDDPAVPLTTIVSDDNDVIEPLSAVLRSPIDATRKQEVKVLSPARAAEIDWDKSAMILWQAALPNADEPIAQQLADFAKNGRAVVFLPIASPGTGSLFGTTWNAWRDVTKIENQASIQWWRASDDLLSNTQGGTTLPVGETEVLRHCTMTGDATPLARLATNDVLLARSSETNVYFLGTLPGSNQSSLARDGVVLYVMLQRALAEGSKTLGNAQMRDATAMHDVRGVAEANNKFTAYNRPLREDSPLTLSNETVNELFTGLQFQRVDDQVENQNSLANEIWRTFLILMALAIIGEAILCLPSKRDAVKVESKREVLA
jgi:hypothetical protein